MVKKKLIKYNAKLLRKLKNISYKDHLTNLHNYQYFIERLEIELKHAKRYKFPVSLLLIDIDYLKSINTTYGHRIGNKVLRNFAKTLLKFSRLNDIAARYGGSKFAMLLLETDKEGVVALAERLLEYIKRHSFKPQNTRIKLKISIGAVSFPEDGIDKAPWFIDAADNALRNSKDDGGNKVSLFAAVKKEKEKISAKKSKEIETLKSKLKTAGKKLDQALLESIYAFAKAIEARDHYTGEHADKMITIVRSIGRVLKLPKKEIINLEHAAVLHDLGKIGIDDRILRKKSSLTKKEYTEIKKHPRIGAEIVRSVHFLKDVVPLILYHHERYDGKGYTSGLKGKDIPIGARVLAIADVFQALISDRPYRKAYTTKKALNMIKNASGGQFDPNVVDALLRSLKKK